MDWLLGQIAESEHGIYILLSLEEYKSILLIPNYAI